MAEHSTVQVRLLRQEQWEALSPLRVEGMSGPLTTLRVFVAWRGLAAYYPLLDGAAHHAAPHKTLTPAPREGSWVVEWGGLELPPLVIC